MGKIKFISFTVICYCNAKTAGFCSHKLYAQSRDRMCSRSSV